MVGDQSRAQLGLVDSVVVVAVVCVSLNTQHCTHSIFLGFPLGAGAFVHCIVLYSCFCSCSCSSVLHVLFLMVCKLAS
jgi:hypothetical protein